MKESFCRKTKYLNHYSFRLLIGSLCLTLPTLSAIILLILWKNFDFLWAPLLFGILGWFLILPSTYALVRPSKERVAVDALSMGFVAMLCLCSAVISFKCTNLIGTLEDQLLQRVNPRDEQFDPKERGIPPEYLEQLRLRMEGLSLASQEEKLHGEDNP
ncbi:MAG: hypothetical protein JNJ47_00275 [Alphaproteobacteria bacterium]|nr:hypothetical protein [Alphaproteobacteria bacterium]